MNFFANCLVAAASFPAFPWFTHARLEFAPVAGFNWRPLAQTEYRMPPLNRAGYGRTIKRLENA